MTSRTTQASNPTLTLAICSTGAVVRVEVFGWTSEEDILGAFLSYKSACSIWLCVKDACESASELKDGMLAQLLH